MAGPNRTRRNTPGGPGDRRDFETGATTASVSEPDRSAPRAGAKKKRSDAPDIGIVGLLRWGWRQLTTMRAALILLLILALAAIPGSLFPQNVQDPAKVTNFIAENGTWAQVLDKLQMFDVYSSFWFSAVYILLMVSLIGCVIPRTAQHYKGMRAQPPKAPRRLSRMPGYSAFALPEGQTAEDVLDMAAARLKRERYRVVRHGDHVAAERGYLRETGNLLFHIALLAVVVTMAVGSMFSYGGQRVLVQGDTFSNSLVSYDSFTPGRFFDSSRLPDFRLKLNDFKSTFDATSTGSQFGQPRSFAADVTETRNGQTTRHSLQVNEPIRMNGSRVYLTGNGYAPRVTVRNAAGKVVFSGPSVFLDSGNNYTSRGVIKVPDMGTAGSGVTAGGATADQLGFGGVLLPTAGLDENGDLVSKFAELRNPLLALSVWKGDLGLDNGTAQSVYSLDTDRMTEVAGQDGKPLTLQLRPGQTEQLPDGMGSIRFDGVSKYVALDVRYDPTQGYMLVFAALLFAGLALSLFVPRRRMWVRVAGERVEVAALARGDDPRVEIAARDLGVELQNTDE